MNAPLNDAVRQALENVTLDDKPQCGLVHKYTLGCAEHRGEGHPAPRARRCVMNAPLNMPCAKRWKDHAG